MTKSKFLEELRDVLSEQLPADQVAEHVAYYRNYIEEQQRNGNSEEEILNMLGDSRLIAKTILDTGSVKKDNPNYFYEQPSENGQNTTKKGLSHKGKMYLYAAITIGIICLIIILITTLLSFLLPVLLPVILFFIVLSLIRKMR